MEEIKSGREKEKVSCRKEGVEEHGWELSIGSREFSRVVFCYLLIETDIHFGGVFFLSAMEAQHMGSAYRVWIKRLLMGGMFFFLLMMTIGMDVRGVWGGH